MKHILSSIINTVIWIVIALLLFMVGSGLYQHFVNAKKYTGFFGIGYAVVVSGSMEPNIHIDDMIIYQSKERGQYALDDVIVYIKERPGLSPMLITHRIVDLDGDLLTTQGDANPVADDPIRFDKVVGRVVWRIPKVGKAVSFVKTPLGLACAVCFIALLFIANMFISKDNKKPHKKEEKTQALFGKGENFG